MLQATNGNLARTAPRHLLAPQHRPSSAWRAELPAPRECPPRFRVTRDTPPKPKESPPPPTASSRRARERQQEKMREERCRMRRDIALRRQGLLSDIQLVTALGAGSCREMLAEPTSGSMDASEAPAPRAEPTSGSMDASEAPAPDDGTSLDHEASKVEAGVSVRRRAWRQQRAQGVGNQADGRQAPAATKHQRAEAASNQEDSRCSRGSHRPQASSA